jgi:hypothetical protein
MLILAACGAPEVEPTPIFLTSTPVVPLTDTPIPPTNTTVPIDPTPVELWQDSLSVEYTPEKDSSYSFVDQSGGKTILRVPVGNASINALLSAVDNDIVSARVINTSGTVDMTVSDFEIEPLGFVPPGYPEGTRLSRFTTKAVNIPVTFGDVLTVTFTGEDGSTGTTTYEVHPSIQDSIETNIQALGMHGAVVNLGSNPTFGHLFDWQTYLQDHLVKVHISQDGEIVQRDVSIEVDQGVTFAELVDFSFKLGVPIDVVINISQNGNNHTAHSTIQGMLQYPPFLMPIFHQSDIDAFGVNLDTIDIHGTEPGEPFPYYAVDFCGNICRPGAANITGLPIYAPGDVQIMQVWGVNEGTNIGNTTENLVVYGYLPDVGLTLFAAHVRPGPLLEQLAAGSDLTSFGSEYPGTDAYLISYNPDVPFLTVGYFGEGHETGIAHLHLAAQVPRPTSSNDGWNKSSGWNYNNSVYGGRCWPEDIGPCPETGTLCVNLNHFRVTGSWIDPSK